MAHNEKRIYFSEEMSFTDSNWVDATDITKRNGWIEFTIGKNYYWEKDISVPASKVESVVDR